MEEEKDKGKQVNMEQLTKLFDKISIRRRGRIKNLGWWSIMIYGENETVRNRG